MGMAPFWSIEVDKMVANTTELTTEEFGAHVLLMMAQWQNNGRPLSDDDHKLARICRLTSRRWKQVVRPAIEEYFDIRDGTWSQKKVAKQFKKVAAKILKNRENAACGGRAKALKAKNRSLANATDSPGDPADTGKNKKSSDSLPKDESEGRRTLPSPKEERESPSSVPGSNAELKPESPSDGNDGNGLHEREQSKSSTIVENDLVASEPFDGPSPSDKEMAAWNQALQTMRERTESTDFKFIQSLELVAVDGNAVTLSAPTQKICDRASELSGRIRDALQDAGLAIATVHIEVPDVSTKG